MTTIIAMLVVVIILYLLFKPRQSHGATGHEHEHRDDDYSYLYYVDRQGKLQYEDEHCRGCIEERVKELQCEGLRVTECVLGSKWSSDL